MGIQKGKILLQQGYGLARLKDRAPITPQTTVEIASMTKVFTGLAVLTLVDRGTLKVDDDIRAHLPELPEYHKDAVIRISHLLNHTSGLPDYLAFAGTKGQSAGFVTCADYAGEFARLQSKHPATFRPGKKFEYSNTNYMLLALIVERVTKKSFGTYLRAEVLGPMGMKHSWVYDSPLAAPKAAQGQEHNAIAYRRRMDQWTEGWGSPPFRHETVLTVGDGGLWTNLEDLARFDAALRAGKLLKPATMSLALTPSKTSDGKTNPYGFGFSLTVDRDGKLTGLGHDGSWVFRTSFQRDLVEDRTIVVLCNQEGSAMTRIRSAIVAALPKK